MASYIPLCYNNNGTVEKIWLSDESYTSPAIAINVPDTTGDSRTFTCNTSTTSLSGLCININGTPRRLVSRTAPTQTASLNVNNGVITSLTRTATNKPGFSIWKGDYDNHSLVGALTSGVSVTVGETIDPDETYWLMVDGYTYKKWLGSELTSMNFSIVSKAVTTTCSFNVTWSYSGTTGNTKLDSFTMQDISFNGSVFGKKIALIDESDLRYYTNNVNAGQYQNYFTPASVTEDVRTVYKALTVQQSYTLNTTSGLTLYKPTIGIRIGKVSNTAVTANNFDIAKCDVSETDWNQSAVGTSYTASVSNKTLSLTDYDVSVIPV